MNEFLQTIIFSYEGYEFKVLNLFLIILALVLIRVVIALSKRYLEKYLKTLDIGEQPQKVIIRYIRSIIYIIALMLIIASAGLNVSNILSFIILSTNKNEISVANIVSVFIIVSLSRFIVWVLLLLLYGYYKKENYDIGTQFAINQILKYLIYTIALLSSIQALGFNLTVIWGGAAALLVGFGLGMQNTFNDLVSGIFMLVERGVHVGDILEVDGKVGKVKKLVLEHLK